MTGMRGSERALELLRQSWTSVPLSKDEQGALLNCAALSAGRFPNAALLCLDVFQTSEQTSFLQPLKSSGDQSTPIELTDRADECTAYQCLRRQFPRNFRLLLTQEEEFRVLGRTDHRADPVAGIDATIEELSCPLDEKIVSSLQTDFASIVTRIKEPVSIDQFPFDLPDSRGALESSIFLELRASWDLNKDSTYVNDKLHAAWSSKVNEIGSKVKLYRKKIEALLLEELNFNRQIQGFNLTLTSSLRLSNGLPTASHADFVRAAYKPSLLTSFSPFLSEAGHKKILKGIAIWLRCCVLEDEISPLDSARDVEALKVAARSACTFAAHDYLAWAAFEVESRIQIRPEQYIVAKYLLENPGNLIQLNMGSGKTRVIIPMLVLHLSLHRKDYDQITRLTILSAIFKENCNYFKSHLTGSLAFVKICTIPFRRDVELDERRVEIMVRLVKQCIKERTVVMVAPEHRLSLELKLIEMSLVESSTTSSVRLGIQYLFGGIWRDILDECDELLHHRFQLVYACGTVEALPSRAHRTQASQTLLNYFWSDPNVKQYLISNRRAFIGSEELENVMVQAERFPSIRLSPPKESASVELAFKSALADAILTDPPYEFEWLRDHRRKAEIRSILIDSKASTRCLDLLEDQHQMDILALRGLLAGEILWHCLQKRHRVDFGIARPGKKRICVPFRGADTPSLRSEFSHPDVAIVLTTLAYYSDGLDEKQVRQAFRELLNLGRIVRQTYYTEWFELSKRRIHYKSPEMEDAIDDVEKIDPSNLYQFKILVEFFSFNMHTINFWLNTCVFPEEMQHHPRRLTASSWNLANNPVNGVIGFSGTNDNHRILPLQVRQFFKEDFSGLDPATAQIWMQMMGTNGRMLKTIIENTIDSTELMPGNFVEAVLWLSTQGDKVHAIIDAGALFVGSSNKKIASRILAVNQLEGNAESFFDGVIFYENGPNELEGWKIMEHSGRILPKETSPVTDDRAFAYFDQPRCRGSDLKLRQNAVAILTLGPKMRKDALMQAAGRMRKLGCHQKLKVVATSDVVRIGSMLFDVKNILFWTLRNTVKMNEEGLMPWTNQGLFFASTQKKPELTMQDEDCSLQRMYGAPFTAEAFITAAQHIQNFHVNLAGGLDSLLSKDRTMIDDIMKRSVELGTHAVCAVRAMDEECERELELEREEEEEKETEVPQMMPLRESEWDHNSVLSSLCPKDLPVEVGVSSLAMFVKDYLIPASLCRIKWSGKVFGTRNFFESVQEATGAKPTSLNFYLRPIDFVIRFSTGEILLLSDREADKILPLFWDEAKRATLSHSISRDGTVKTRNELFQFSVLRAACDGKIPGLTLSSMALSSTADIGDVQPFPDDIIAEIQLFGGETTYHTTGRKEAVETLLQEACFEPEQIVEMRDLSETFPFSDLEKICSAIAKKTDQAFATGGMRR